MPSKMSDHRGIAINVFEKNHVILDQEIGHGSFGKVFIGAIVNTNLSPVAVKVFFKEIKNRGQISPADKEKAYEELLKVAVIDHENIVKLHGMVKDDLPWLVFEYMKDGNLLEYVRKSGKIKERELLRFCRDICSGMTFLHQNQILHKDIAARNILLNDNTAKIADLGLSSFLTNNDEGIYALNGKLFPYRHAAVECIVEQLFTYESDVWAFGVCMYEIFTGGMIPYGRENKEAEVRRFIVDHITPMHIIEPQCSTKVYSIMKSILNPVLRDRPSFATLHATFDRLLNGKTNVESSGHLYTHNEQPNISSALSAFHLIKTNGLSSSMKNLNLQLSSSSSSSSLVEDSGPVPAYATNKGLLTVTSYNASRSTSTPDIINELAAEEAQLHDLNGRTLRRKASRVRRDRENVQEQPTIQTANKLSVHAPFGSDGRRHSADLLARKPLRSEYNSEFQSSQYQQSGMAIPSTSPVQRYLDPSGGDEPRSRAHSGSRTGTMTNRNPLLDGFVQNRFSAKRKA